MWDWIYTKLCIDVLFCFDGTATVPECEINAVTKTDDWKLGENINAHTDSDYPRDDSIAC